MPGEDIYPPLKRVRRSKVIKKFHFNIISFNNMTSCFSLVAAAAAAAITTTVRRQCKAVAHGFQVSLLCAPLAYAVLL